MPLLTRHRLRTLPRTIVWLVAVWLCAAAWMAGLLGDARALIAHGHAHRAVSAASALASSASPHDVDHGHDHSGDPIQDLLTLGHHHVGCPSLGLPPDLVLRVPVFPPTNPAFLPRRSFLEDEPPQTLFRPPIA